MPPGAGCAARRRAGPALGEGMWSCGAKGRDSTGQQPSVAGHPSPQTGVLLLGNSLSFTPDPIRQKEPETSMLSSP